MEVLGRVCDVMWCLVVRISHIGVVSVGEGEEESARRFFLVVREASWVIFWWMCVRRAVEALRVCRRLD